MKLEITKEQLSDGVFRKQALDVICDHQGTVVVTELDITINKPTDWLEFLNRLDNDWV